MRCFPLSHQKKCRNRRRNNAQKIYSSTMLDGSRDNTTACVGEACVRRRCTVSSPLIWPSNIEIRWQRTACDYRLSGWLLHLAETQFVGSSHRVDTRRVLSMGGILSPMGAAVERPEFDINPPSSSQIFIVP